MNPACNTFERIQNEIRENLEREKELKNGHSSLNEVSYLLKEESTSVSNGTNGILSKSNGFTRRFIPNTNTRGVMQKFFKNRGKISQSALNSPEPQHTFAPAKGICVRNGYVPTEEKIVKELLDFQKREMELREERRKSQPDLMKALELEEHQLKYQDTRSMLKSTKSLSNLYQSGDNINVIGPLR
ncbi:uncharacterized protein LOC130446722 [Diorhabda sublineata]|uniref:uncharacterized protein LOC130446722 n=1 Tax=Diorhabda sublineata TaxID=1163346 RepID=UPI0024E04BC7|nr:uncharacterized protein LOC130446722 [Diorhabda sublineata]